MKIEYAIEILSNQIESLIMEERRILRASNNILEDNNKKAIDILKSRYLELYNAIDQLNSTKEKSNKDRFKFA